MVRVHYRYKMYTVLKFPVCVYIYIYIYVCFTLQAGNIEASVRKREIPNDFVELLDPALSEGILPVDLFACVCLGASELSLT